MQQKSLFRNRNFLVLLIGQVVSNIGNPFTGIATAWMVYDITGSKLALGGIMLAHSLPMAALRLVAGPLVDRWDRRRVMVITDLVRALALLAVVALFWTDRLELWHLFALNIAMGSAEAFFGPSTFAMVPRLVSSGQLIAANGLMNTAVSSGMLVGPALAGVVIATIGPAAALLVDALTFLASTLALLLLPAQKPDLQAGVRNFGRELGEGFAFFRQHSALLLLLGLASFSNLAGGVAISLAIPLARDVLGLGADGFGLMQPAVAVGFLMGGVASIWAKKLPRRLGMLGAHTLSGIFVACLGLSRWFPLALMVLTGFGISIAIWNAFSGALYQQMVPDRLRGRVQSVRLLVAQGSGPLGMAVGGSLGEWLGIGPTYLMIGLLIAASGAIALALPAFHRVDSLGEEKPAAASTP